MEIFNVIALSGFSAISIALLLFVVLVLSSYVKIVTVLGILRVGLGFDSIPSALVTSGLALALAFFVMYPVLENSGQAMDTASRSQFKSKEAKKVGVLNAGFKEWKKFLELHTHKEELENFSEIASKINKSQQIAPSNISSKDNWRALVPAFVVSELKEAFATGLSIFLPFLVIDLFIATVLVAVGIEDLNPLVVAFPFKLLLFVLVDGWSLITSNLVQTYIV